MAHLPDSQFTDSSMDYHAAVLRGEGLAMPEPTCDQRLVLLCLNELDTLARLIAVTGSTANAIATGRAKHDLGPALIAFLPPAPKTCATMLSTDSGASLPLPVLTALQVFEVKIAAAKDMTRAVKRR